MISYALEYTLSEIKSFDVLQSLDRNKELFTIPLEEIGKSYTELDFVDNNISFSVLMDLKSQLSPMSLTAAGNSQHSDDDVHQSTCL